MTRTMTIAEGDLVRYQHPDWGPSVGRVLRVGDPALDGRTCVLVLDLAPNGAREWWPLVGLELAMEAAEAARVLKSPEQAAAEFAVEDGVDVPESLRQPGPPTRDWTALLPDHPHVAARLRLVDRDWTEHGVEVWRVDLGAIEFDIAPSGVGDSAWSVVVAQGQSSVLDDIESDGPTPAAALAALEAALADHANDIAAARGALTPRLRRTSTQPLLEQLVATARESGPLYSDSLAYDIAEELGLRAEDIDEDPDGLGEAIEAFSSALIALARDQAEADDAEADEARAADVAAWRRDRGC